MNKLQSEFESWWQAENGFLPEKWPNGSYKALSVTRQWQAWCAALAFARGLIAGDS